MSPPTLFDPLRPLNAEGLVAITADVDVALLTAAYRAGAFPWCTQPVGWYAPPRRAVVPSSGLRLPSNLARLYRRSGLQLTCDVAFGEVMTACRDSHLAAGRGAWIDDSLIRAYRQLADLGMAHSVEVWAAGTLVGGVYGVQIGRMFAAESMFHRHSNASKFALAALGGQLRALEVILWDIQVINPFTRSLGAVEVGRDSFCRMLKAALQGGSPPAPWPRQPLDLGGLGADEPRSPPCQ